MHIPDGFLDAKTLALTGALSAGGLAVAARQVSRTLARRKIPLMGLGAAFVFAAQMLIFPVAGGTSGHLLGGVLAAALLGPSAAAIVSSEDVTKRILVHWILSLTARSKQFFSLVVQLRLASQPREPVRFRVITPSLHCEHGFGQVGKRTGFLPAGQQESLILKLFHQVSPHQPLIH